MRLVKPFTDKAAFFICKPCKPSANGATSYAERA